MANWAWTDYVVEGPEETLQKIYDAFHHHEVEEGSTASWEGNILKALGITWKDRKIISKKKDGEITFLKTKGYYMRGFIQDAPYWDNDGNLRFSAEEAWGATDFHELLEMNFPDIKVYYFVEEGIYATNDKEGKYFKNRFYADCCIDGEYFSEYFMHESDMFKWLYRITDGRVDTMEKADAFNEEYEDSEDSDDNFIFIYKCSIVD